MNIGIVGCGMIVNQCLKALMEVEGVKCTALCVREEEAKIGEELTKKYEINKLYLNYDDILCDNEIDFIYIGIINNLHYSYSKKALLMGKNVICEKPLTSTFKEAEDLVELAQKKSLYLFEAITMLYSPNFIYLKNQLSKVGQVKLIQCNYSQYSSRYNKYLQGIVLPAFSPELSGGALYDINIYNLHFVINLFGKPKKVHYIANLGFNGIDTSGILTLEYKDFKAVCSGAKDSASYSYALVQGIDGSIRLTSPPNTCKSVELITGDRREEYNNNLYDNHMVNEFIAFKEIYKNRDLSRCYKNLKHSLTVMEVAHLARKDAGIVFKADIE